MVIEYKYIESCPIISIVDEPAVESEFLLFNKHQELFYADDEKKMITGIALRADYEIPRNGYSIVFRAPEIEKLAYNTMLNGFQMTFNHDKSDFAEVALVESYILRQPDDRFPDVAVGSWLITIHALTPECWKRIKSEGFRGFSVEVLVDAPKSTFKAASDDDFTAFLY